MASPRSPGRRRFLPLLAAALALLAGPVLAEWRDIPYADVTRMPIGLAAVDPGHVFTYRFRVQPGKGESTLPADLQLRLQVAGQVHPLAIGADNRVDMPIRKDWADSGAILQLNQPKGRVSLSLSFDARTPPGTRMHYAQLAESGPVLEHGIQEMAGMLRLFAPKVRSFDLRFAAPGPQTLTLTQPGGKPNVWKTDVRGVLNVPWNAAWSAAEVVLSAPLKGLDPVMK